MRRPRSELALWSAERVLRQHVFLLVPLRLDEDGTHRIGQCRPVLARYQRDDAPGRFGGASVVLAAGAVSLWFFSTKTYLLVSDLAWRYHESVSERAISNRDEHARTCQKRRT